jgi:hypothetical protein
MGAPSLDSTASELRDALAAGEDDDGLLRLVIQASDDFRALSDDHGRSAFLAQPESTGDPRFDALLAGLAVHLAREAGMATTPAWTRAPERYVEPIWWFGLPAGSGLQAFTLQRTPSCFKSRGVMFNVDNLASV